MKTIAMLLAGILFVGVIFASFQVNAPNNVKPGDVFNVTGYVLDANGAGVSNANVTANLSGTLANGTTNANGYFTFNMTAPANVNGSCAVVASNNYSSTTKSVPTYLTNVTNATVTFTSTNFSTGSTFTVNVTILNSSGGGIVNYYPVIRIFRENGGEQNWSIANLSGGTNTGGSMLYNITIPGDAATGPYAIIVEKGAGFAPFYVLSNIRLVAKTSICDATSGCEDTTDFYPGENITIGAKLRYVNNTAIAGQTVTAVITLANGTATSMTLSDLGDGLYEGNYSAPAAATGAIGLDIAATIGNSTVRTTTTTSLEVVDVMLMPKTSAGVDKIMEFGKFKGVRPGGSITYLVAVANESSGTYYSVAAAGGAGNVLNCSAIRLHDFVRTENSTSYNSTVSGSYSTGTASMFGNTVCSITLTVPGVTGTYKWSVVVPFNGTNYNESAYVPVQQYMLRVFPQSSTGGGGPGMFQQMFRPGANVTFVVEAYDVNGTKVPDANLSGVNASSMFNLPTATKLVASTDFAVTNITQTTSLNSITITLPTAYTDAFSFVAIASVYGGTAITGDAFFFSKYIVGFIGPSIEANGEGGGMGGGPMGMSAESACEGNETFRGDVRLADTFETISGVQLHAKPTVAMREMSGQSVMHCITFTPTVSVNTTPSLITNVSFNSSCSLSGEYFMLANVTFIDENHVSHVDSIPGFFRCARFSGMFNVFDESGNYMVGSDATLNVTASGFRFINGSNLTSGVVTVLGVFVNQYEAMEPPELYQTNSSHTMQFNLVNGTAAFQMKPQNFTLPNGKWSQSQGFVNFKFQVCTGTSCSTFERGMMVDSGIRAWWGAMPGTPQLVPGNVVTLSINAKTNVSNVTAGFESSGMMGSTPATTLAGKLFDGWNGSNDNTAANGYETWEVNITVPSNLRTGGSTIIVTVNSSAAGNVGEKATLRIFGTSQGATVGIAQADMQMTDTGLFPTTAADNATLIANGWNLSFIKMNISGLTDINLSLPVSFRNNLSINLFSPQGMQQMMVDSNLSLLVLVRNGTISRTANTLLLRNTSMGNSMMNVSAFSIANITNRSLAGGLYLWDLMGGGSYIRLANANASSNNFRTYAGEQTTGSAFVIPYIVRQGTTPVANVTVNISNVYQETDMGYGLGSPYTGYQVTAATTDANGIAFITMNISSSGRYKMFWKVNGTVNESASSSNQYMGGGGITTGPTQVNVRGFMVMTNFLTDVLGYGMFNITNKSNGAWNFFTGWGSGAEIFNGTRSGFLNGSGVFYFGFNASNNETRMNWTQYSSLATCSGLCTISSEHTFSGMQLELSAFRGIDADTYSVALYNSSMGSTGWCKKVNSATETILLRVCAEGFETLSRTRYAGANISAIWVQAGGVQTPATMRDPVTNVVTASIATGPAGCVATRINTTWPSWSGQIGVNITYNGVTESLTNLNIGQNQYCQGGW